MLITNETTPKEELCRVSWFSKEIGGRLCVQRSQRNAGTFERGPSNAFLKRTVLLLAIFTILTGELFFRFLSLFPCHSKVKTYHLLLFVQAKTLFWETQTECNLSLISSLSSLPTFSLFWLHVSLYFLFLIKCWSFYHKVVLTCAFHLKRAVLLYFVLSFSLRSGDFWDPFVVVDNWTN